MKVYKQSAEKNHGNRGEECKREGATGKKKKGTRTYLHDRRDSVRAAETRLGLSEEKMLKTIGERVSEELG